MSSSSSPFISHLNSLLSTISKSRRSLTRSILLLISICVILYLLFSSNHDILLFHTSNSSQRGRSTYPSGVNHHHLSNPKLGSWKSKSGKGTALGPGITVDYSNLPPPNPRKEDLVNPDLLFKGVKKPRIPEAKNVPFPEDRMASLYPREPPKPGSKYYNPPREEEKQEEQKEPQRGPAMGKPFVESWTSPSWFEVSPPSSSGSSSAESEYDDDHNIPPSKFNPHPNLGRKKRKKLPKIQYDFKAQGWSETKEEMKLTRKRKAAIRRGFMDSWGKYKIYAWGHDEIRPVSLWTSDNFQQWGATIIDSLETLLIMELPHEYTLARPFVNQLDFRLIHGKDWARGFNPTQGGGFPGQPDSDNSGLSAQDKKLREGRDETVTLGVFETGIRYLGGLIGAYDLTGDRLMLERAEDLGRLLGSAFDSRSGLPPRSWDAGHSEHYIDSGHVLLAEVGSMTLELTRLSQLTGKREYFDKAQRALDYIEKRVIPKSFYKPLLPAWFHSDLLEPVRGKFTLGGMADSYYEYLIKQHLMVGGETDQYWKMYVGAMDKAQELIFADVEILQEAGRDYMTIGTQWHDRTKMDMELEHLVCFAGGMLGMGSRLLGRARELILGSKITDTCYYLGAVQPSGLQPEIATFYRDEREAYMKVVPTKEGPDTNVTLKNHGISGVVQHYLGRPETIESVFYMFRLTGDKVWRDKGWRMFASWVETCRAQGGMSSVGDVRQGKPEHTDSQESFVFAETFKYHYLLQSDPEFLSLDDYVFSTEAHPFLVNDDIEPGSQGLWQQHGQDLGIRARGTDVQLWERWRRLHPGE